ncbi:MAG TPA: DUF927 domain-containing protein [Methylocella sp.]|jgi:hypothetical protein
MKKRPKKTNPSKVADAGPRGGWAFVYEPDDPSCKPTAKWSVRYRRVELTAQYDIEIRFRTRGGKCDTIIMSARDRSEFEKIRRELCARDARLPNDRKASTEFVETLLRATPKQAVKVVSKAGFRDGATGFVMPARMYGAAEGRFVWDDIFADPAFGEIKGNLAQFEEGVLMPALASPFLSFAILIGLAAPLPSYVEQKDGCGKLVPEGAIFHPAADSSAGKTLCARVTQSVFGSPEVFMDYQATERGVAEACYAHNDLVVVLDDTETAALEDGELFRAMKLFGQRLPAGRSKAIAKIAAKSGLPPMTWFCFGVSTGPETLAELGQRLHKKLHGLRVRFIDLPLPPSARGGIFARVMGEAQLGVENPGELIKKIETAISQNHGVMMDAWIHFLLSDDHSERIREMVDKFVEMTAGGEHGLEARFARKFGVIYAAGLLAVKAGLLPWSTDWVAKAVRYCYDLARNTRDPDARAVETALKAIARALKIKGRFPRHDLKQRRTPVMSERALGLRVSRENKSRWYICPDRLDLVGVKDPRVRRLIIEKAKELKLIVASNNASSSVQMRVRTAEGSVRKLRVWRLRRDRTLAWAENRRRVRQR